MFVQKRNDVRPQSAGLHVQKILGYVQVQAVIGEHIDLYAAGEQGLPAHAVPRAGNSNAQFTLPGVV